MIQHLSKPAILSRLQSADIFADTPWPDSQIIQRPVFLVGAERSGTMLLRQMLDHHPHIAFWSKFDYAVSEMDRRGAYPALPRYYQTLRANKDFLIDGLTIDRSLPYPMLVNSFLQQCQHLHRKPHIGATVHCHFDRLLKIWPDARFIHIVRDGRDVARSCMNMGWADSSWHAAARWLAAETLWNRLSSQLTPDRYIEVRFESLIEDPRASLEPVCAFMGERYHPDMMTYPQNSSYGRPDMSLVNQWHHKMSKRDIQLIESRIAPLLVERNYPLSGLPHLRPSRTEQFYLKMKHKVGKLSHRIQKYGLRLTSADLLARRLHLSGLRDRTRKQLNIIDIQTMKQSW